MAKKSHYLETHKSELRYFNPKYDITGENNSIPELTDEEIYKILMVPVNEQDRVKYSITETLLIKALGTLEIQTSRIKNLRD